MIGGRRPRPPARSGTTIEVHRGRVTFTLGQDRIQCGECKAYLEHRNDGPAIQAFLVEHAHTPPPPAAPADQVEQIVARLRALAADEIEVVGEVIAGLERGRGIYGELRIDADPRDHDREALDEVRDGLVYAAVAAIRRRRREAPR